VLCNRRPSATAPAAVPSLAVRVAAVAVCRTSSVRRRTGTSLLLAVWAALLWLSIDRRLTGSAAPSNSQLPLLSPRLRDTTEDATDALQ
jgi:hypothetical protein